MVSTTLAATRLCPPGRPRPGWVTVERDTILERGDGPPPPGAEDLGDTLLVPGFVDLQVNGVGDVDFATASADGFARAGRAQLVHGVTAYCPTLITAPLDAYAAALQRLAAARRAAAADGLPAVLGAHLEGPFLGGAPGAHPAALVRGADAGWLADLVDAAPGEVAVVTLAPEADPGAEAVRALVARDVVVALGHSTATYDEACAAVDAGARLATHVFNAMGPLHQREPGLVGLALDDDRLTPSLIADLVHLHPAVVRLVVHATPRAVLVTDAVAVTADDGVGAARLPDGTLAGSILSMDRAVGNVVGLGIPVERAVAMATETPAAVLGDEARGRLDPGRRADLVALDPATFAVRGVWLAGERVV
jgi:N-acetylglucosamine-6-phosphate deacetylase